MNATEIFSPRAVEDYRNITWSSFNINILCFAVWLLDCGGLVDWLNGAADAAYEKNDWLMSQLSWPGVLGGDLSNVERDTKNLSDDWWLTDCIDQVIVSSGEWLIVLHVALSTKNRGDYLSTGRIFQLILLPEDEWSIVSY
jgi:hypothetical protein